MTQTVNADRGHLPMLLQAEAAECGLVCLAMVSSFHGHHCDLQQLRCRFPQSMAGVNLRQLMNVAAALNLTPRAVRLEPEDLTSLTLPCILHWNLDHFVVLKSVGRRYIALHDPALGTQRLPMAELCRHFTGIALELTPAPGFTARARSPGLHLSMFWRGARGLGRSLTFLLLLTLLLQLFAVASPLYVQTVVDDALKHNDNGLLPVLALGFGLLVVTETITGALRQLVVINLSSRLALQMSANLFHHLLRLPAEYFATRHLGDTVSRFGSLDSLRQMLTTGLVTALVDGIMAIVTFAMMLAYDALLSSLVIILVGLYAGLRVALYFPARRLSQEAIAADAATQSSFMESVRGIVTVKLQQRETERQQQWQNRLARGINRGVRLQQLGVAHNSANTLLFGLGHILVVYQGAQSVMATTMSVGMLYAFLSYTQRFIGAMEGLVDQLVEIRMLGVHLERLSDIALTDREPCLLESDETGVSDNRRAPLVARNLGFRYGEQSPPVLQGLDLSIEMGESVAICGPSGSGKSTLLRCLMGLLPASDGSILQGERPVYGSSNYRRSIAAVLQDDQLFAGTIADNVCSQDPGATLERIVDCASLACIHEDIAALPMQYNTLVGDMGSTLSGGQKQRILLARALYRAPSILFLDEATCHLDQACEAQVNRNIAAMNITRIFVAHSPAAIASADRVIELG